MKEGQLHKLINLGNKNVIKQAGMITDELADRQTDKNRHLMAVESINKNSHFLQVESRYSRNLQIEKAIYR